jgi:hypothetical protein
MRIPPDAVIPREKLTKYLLIWLPKRDKSKYLARAGYTLETVEALETAIRQLIATNDAIEDANDQYGTRYRVVGTLYGLNGVDLGVVTIWIHRNPENYYQFLTLIPAKRR